VPKLLRSSRGRWWSTMRAVVIGSWHARSWTSYGFPLVGTRIDRTMKLTVATGLWRRTGVVLAISSLLWWRWIVVALHNCQLLRLRGVLVGSYIWRYIRGWLPLLGGSVASLLCEALLRVLVLLLLSVSLLWVRLR
jgi:hypothetical protein